MCSLSALQVSLPPPSISPFLITATTDEVDRDLEVAWKVVVYKIKTKTIQSVISGYFIMECNKLNERI